MAQARLAETNRGQKQFEPARLGSQVQPVRQAAFDADNHPGVSATKLNVQCNKVVVDCYETSEFFAPIFGGAPHLKGSRFAGI